MKTPKLVKNRPLTGAHHAILLGFLGSMLWFSPACIEEDLTGQLPGMDGGSSSDLDAGGDGVTDQGEQPDTSGTGGGDDVIVPDAGQLDGGSGGEDLTGGEEEDMGKGDDGGVLPPSRCTELAREIACTYHTTELDIDGISRDIHWEVPAGEAPASGWPIVVFFQGSFFSSEYSWEASEGTPYGAYQLTRTFKALLDDGFAILAPEASFGGSTYWDTNIWPYNYSWESSNDHELMLALFDEAGRGTFGELDTNRWFATGISSGGYMTSRMAIAYPGKFRALAIASGSYATCAGVVCSVPDADELPTDHPPTLFLHGSLDATVPLYTMESYAEELTILGTANTQVIDDTAGHEWLPAAVEALPSWFKTHP